MAQQAKQAAQKLGGMFPQGSGKGVGGAVGAIAVLGALGYGVNASLFNGNFPLSGVYLRVFFYRCLTYLL
jgi:hypothetical protein